MWTGALGIDVLSDGTEWKEGEVWDGILVWGLILILNGSGME